MDFSLTTEQTELQEDIRTFASSLNDCVIEDDRDQIFPREKWERCRELRLHGLQVPCEYGGAGHGMLTSVLGMEAFGYGCRDNGLGFALNAQMLIQLPIIHHGSDRQKRDWLPGLASGAQIGAFAFTESDSGSDLYSMKTRARPVEGGYLLTGEKALITYGPVADVAIVFASTAPERGSWGLTAFLVGLKRSGVSVGDNQAKMGMRTVPFGTLRFSDCFVDGGEVLGRIGAGLGILNRSLEWDRCCVLASQLGAMERILEDCVDYAQQRQQFGQPIGQFQSVSNRIADMKLRLEASRLLLYKAAWAVDQGQPATMDAAISKLSLSESFLASSLDAVRIHGGKGYCVDEGIERSVRDSIGGVIYGGTSDIQRLTIAKLLGL